MPKQRLDKIIASQTGISRSIVRTQIRKGAVLVDGLLIKDPSFLFQPENVSIKYAGEELIYKKHIYIMMNKPKGVLSASEDKNRKTVIDLVPENLFRKGLFPVGRLDKDTTGLLLITDDGEFAHNVISPKKDIDKVYISTLDGQVTESMSAEFKKGIVLADGTKCLSANLEIIGENKAKVTIKEGKYHQIKRMFGVVGLGVNELHRCSIGGLFLPENLESGNCVELTNNQLNSVFLEK